MPICNYFLNGNCRFGSKCVNDHIDLKMLLKNDSEAQLTGKQWLLSCYGPFKESTSLPNFINDQSFEEIRLAFLENSKNGNLQSYINNLMTEYNNAVRKVNDLKMPSQEILHVVASIYSSSSKDPKPSDLKPAATQNPFQANVFGGSNPQQQGTTMSTSNIFGSSNPSSNPFQQTAQNTMGNSQQSAFSFALNQPTQQSSSIFSTQQQQQQQPSIFSSTQQPQTNQSVFSNQQNVFAQPSNNSFAMSTSSPASNTSMFGSSIQQPATQTTQHNIFGAQMPAQPAAPPQNVFGSFAQNSTFATQNSSIFATQQQAAPTTQNIFAQQPAAATTNNVFAQFTNTPANNTQMGQEPPQAPANIFGGMQNVEQQKQLGISPFQMPQQNQQVPSQQVFGGNPFQQPVAFNDEHFYSKQEDLSADDIQAFQAESFTLGKIPLLPPSKSLALG